MALRTNQLRDEMSATQVGVLENAEAGDAVTYRDGRTGRVISVAKFASCNRRWETRVDGTTDTYRHRQDGKYYADVTSVDDVVSVTPAPAKPAEEVGEYAYASKQATNCAGCLEHKHTPFRRDELGGYVCLTCIDRELDKLRTALRFYADSETWTDHGYENGLHWVEDFAIWSDQGRRAREALGESPSPAVPVQPQQCAGEAAPVKDLSVSGELPGDAPAAVIQGPGRYVTDDGSEAIVVGPASTGRWCGYVSHEYFELPSIWGSDGLQVSGMPGHNHAITGPYVDPPKPVLTIEEKARVGDTVFAWSRCSREGDGALLLKPESGNVSGWLGRDFLYVMPDGPFVCQESDWPRVQELVAKVNAENGKAGE